jgi:hypothetical protein
LLREQLNDRANPALSVCVFILEYLAIMIRICMLTTVITDFQRFIRFILGLLTRIDNSNVAV